VGYGLAEMEILEYVLAKKPGSDGKPEIRHYLLLPVRGYEAAIAKHLKKYFANHCSVEVIEYNIDHLGHYQLCDLLEGWTNQLRVPPPTFVDKLRIIDEAMNE
jgi:hypothetical protein